GGGKLVVHRPDRPGIAESNQLDDGSLHTQPAAEPGREHPGKGFEPLLKCEKPADGTPGISLSANSLGQRAQEQTAALLFPPRQPRERGGGGKPRSVAGEYARDEGLDESLRNLDSEAPGKEGSDRVGSRRGLADERLGEDPKLAAPREELCRGERRRRHRQRVELAGIVDVAWRRRADDDRFALDSEHVRESPDLGRR